MDRRRKEVREGELYLFPELVLPAQFFSDRLFVGHASGEMALRWAVFSDGISQYWRLAARPAKHTSEEFLEEENWLLADDTEWPFAFVSLCEAFGLRPSSVRSSLLAWKEAHVAPPPPRKAAA